MVSIKQIKSDIIGPILFQGASRIERSLDLIWDDTLKEFQINGDVVFKNTSNAFNLHLKAGTTANDITYILPITDPTAGQVLTASLPVLGVSTLSWTNSSGSGTADNGLTMTLGNVQLGGLLIQDTIIDGALNAWSVTFTDVNLFTADATSFNLNSQTFVDTYAVGDINDTGANHLGTYSGSYTTVANDITLSSFILTTIDSDIIELQAISSIVLNSTGATTIDSAAGGITISTNTGGDISLVSVNNAFISAAASTISINLYGTPQTVTNNGTDNSMIVTDAVNSKGLVYVNDYSANFTPESLVSKRYVDSVISGAITADNGLTYTFGNIQLGGPLTQNTIIDGLNTYILQILDAEVNIETSFNKLLLSSGDTSLTRIVSASNYTILSLQNTSGFLGVFDTSLALQNLFYFDSAYISVDLNSNQTTSDPFGQFRLDNTGMELFWCDGDVLTTSSISTFGTVYALDPTLVNLTIRGKAGVGIYTTDATGVVQQSIVLSETAQTNTDTSIDNHMVVSDPVFLKGLVYADDYSALFSGNSLVNKIYVDNAVSGNTLATVLTAGNTSGGIDILFTAGSGIDTTATGGTDTLNIGTGNADVINIGRTGATVNIFGTRNFIQTTDLEILDKLIVLNKNGAASTGFGTGFEIEENAIVTGYFKTNGTADGWLFKAPTSFQLELLTSSLTANRIYTAPNVSGTIITTGNLSDITAVGTITSGIWNGTAITNTYLANSTITVNGASTALGSSVTITTTGTTNRIDVTGGTGLTPTIDIAATYVGQTSITTVGTITSGTWNGTIIGTTYGGTGTGTTFTAGSIVFAGASGIYNQDNANFFWDDTNDRLGIKTNAPAKTLHVAGDIRFEPVSGVLMDVESATVNTTNNTTTTIQTIAIPTDTVVMIEARVHSRKTGGAGVGTTGDGNAYIRTVKAKNVGGTVTIGTVASTFTSEDIASFNATLAVSGTNIIVRVTGSANNNVTWTSSCIITR